MKDRAERVLESLGAFPPIFAFPAYLVVGAVVFVAMLLFVPINQWDD